MIFLEHSTQGNVIKNGICMIEVLAKKSFWCKCQNLKYYSKSSYKEIVSIMLKSNSPDYLSHTVLGAVWIKDTLKKKIKTLENFFRNWDYILSGS